MDDAIENGIHENELEEVTVNKLQNLVTDSESKSMNQMEKKSNDEFNLQQTECNNESENIGEPEINLESCGGNNTPCSMEKGVESKIKDNKKDFQNGSNDQSTLDQNPEIIPTEKIVEENNEKLIEEESNEQATSNQSAEVDVDNATDENNIQDTDQGSSTQVPIREKCKYGSQCYRLNAEHKAQFSHPEDADYNHSDNRPECPYGVQCYRKNPQHKLDYKHSSNKRKRTQTPGQTATLDDFSDFEDSMEESVDESDEYDGSFIDDDDFDDDFESELSDQLDDDNSENEDNKKKKKVKNRTSSKKTKKM